MDFVASEKLSLARHEDFDEAWVEKTIREHPEMLALGALENIRNQLSQRGSGRLDLLADNRNEAQRFVIELMLGELDASHLMRVMDYWLKRKSQDIDSDLDVVAVLVAEKVLVSRYFPLIQFLAQKLASHLPLIVIEMTALKVGAQMTLSFTKVIDSGQEEIFDDDIEERVPPDHADWISRSSEDTMYVVDKLFSFLREIDQSLSPKYNAHYIGITKGHRTKNFAWFSPKTKFLRTNVKVENPESWQERLRAGGLDVMESSGDLVRFRIKKEKLELASTVIKEVLKASYEQRFEEAE